MPPPPRPAGFPLPQSPTYASVIRAALAHDSSSFTIDPPLGAEHALDLTRDIDRNESLDDLDEFVFAPQPPSTTERVSYPWRRVGRDGEIEDLSPIDPDHPFIPNPYPPPPNPYAHHSPPVTARPSRLAPYVSLDRILDEAAAGSNSAPTSAGIANLPPPVSTSPMTRGVPPRRPLTAWHPRGSQRARTAEELALDLDEELVSSGQPVRDPVTDITIPRERQLTRRAILPPSMNYGGNARRMATNRSDRALVDEGEFMFEGEEDEDEDMSEDEDDDDGPPFDAETEEEDQDLEDEDDLTALLDGDDGMSVEPMLAAMRRQHRLYTRRPARRAAPEPEMDMGIGSSVETLEAREARRRAFSRFYSPRDNASREDLSIVGGSGGMLRRGQNNRRRRSIVGRRMEEVVIPDQAVRASGLRPTNMDTNGEPLVVQTDSRGPTEPKFKKRRLMKPIPPTELPLDLPRPSYLSYNQLTSSLNLPTHFIPPPRNSRTEPRISLKPHTSPGRADRHCVTFLYKHTSEVDPDAYAQSIRADLPIPVQCGVYYYEAEVLDAGVSGYMSVGWMSKRMKMNRLVGWDRGSWGWHGDDGMTFAGQGMGNTYGPSWTKGDVVGCGIDFTIKRAFFTKNGQMIGHVFSNLWEGLYPAVGLRTLGESLAVDLTGPFKFDIDSYARNLRDTTWSEALRPPPAFKPPPKETSPVSDLSDTVLPAVSRLHDPTDRVCAAWVLDHLRQEGHQDTLAALRKDMQSKRWLHPRLDDFAIPPLNETAGSKTTYDENSTLKSFETKEQAVLWLEQRLIDADVQPFPWPFCIDVGLEKDLPRLKIHRYLSLLRQADQARCTVSQTTTKGDTEMISRNLEKTEDVDLDIEALQWGRECVKESKDWSEEDRGLMSSATALMGLSPGHWPEDGVGGKAQRLADTERIVSALRVRLHVKSESYLARDLRQTTTTLNLTAAKDARMGYIDMSRFLHDPEAFHTLSRRYPKSSRIKAEGEVKETGDGSLIRTNADEGVVRRSVGVDESGRAVGGEIKVEPKDE